MIPGGKCLFSSELLLKMLVSVFTALFSSMSSVYCVRACVSFVMISIPGKAFKLFSPPLLRKIGLIRSD